MLLRGCVRPACDSGRRCRPASRAVARWRVAFRELGGFRVTSSFHASSFAGFAGFAFTLSPALQPSADDAIISHRRGNVRPFDDENQLVAATQSVEFIEEPI